MDYALMVKNLRNKMMLTQQELADKLSVTFETINRWENSKFMPTMKLRRKLSALFKKYGIEEIYKKYEE
ncbi:multiprotein-bridging factor 1 family protein [Mycoplasma corogypsi]|uniref:helix-turn-helix domain-containing protein n=1 Tax=Mycoplasma corogypsi TaxID=2106 RepID=UPI003873C5FD